MRKRLERVTITIPADLLSRADAQAARLKRSRSWLIVEALRALLAGPRHATVVREAPATPYAVTPGLGGQRLHQLRADMALTPEQRVREAQVSTEEAFRIHRLKAAPFVMVFDRYEDFLDWKRRDRLW